MGTHRIDEETVNRLKEYARRKYEREKKGFPLGLTINEIIGELLDEVNNNKEGL